MTAAIIITIYTGIALYAMSKVKESNEVRINTWRKLNKSK